MTDRIPPQAIDIERTILGSMLIDDKCCSVAFEFLNEDSFYMNAHRKIFSAMKNLFIKTIPVDTISVSDALTKLDQIDSVGGDVYIAELTQSIVSFKNIEHYSKILREKQLRRKIIEEATIAIDSAFEENNYEASDISSNLVSVLINAADYGRRSMVRYADILPQEFERLEKVCNGEKTADLTTGLRTIDDHVYIQNHDLIVVAGRPSNGKSSLAGCIARNIGKQGKVVLCINLESSNENELSRALFSEAKVNLNQFNLGFTAKRDLPKLSLAAGQLMEMNVYLDDSPDVTPSRMYAKALKVKHEAGRLDLIIVDYLQLMNDDKEHRDVRDRINSILTVMKKLPKIIGCPIMLLSQVSRYKSEKEEAPDLGNLKESGMIEESADKVFILYTPSFYDSSKDKTLMELYIAKYKNGRVGKKNMTFLREYFLVSDREENYEESGF